MFTTSSVKTKVRELLGEGLVDVELTDNQLRTFVTKATQAINSYLPNRRWVLLPTQNPGRFLISDKAGVTPTSGSAVTYLPGFSQVITVEGVRNSVMNVERIDLYNPITFIQGGLLTDGGLAAYIAAQNQIKQARSVFSSDLSFRGFWAPEPVVGGGYERVYNLYISRGDDLQMTYGMEYATAMTDDDDPLTGIGYLGDEMQHWFLKYCLAEAKRTLGRALNKHQGIPSPEGVDVQLDGLDLKSDGDNESEMLMRSLMSMSKNIGPYIG